MKKRLPSICLYAGIVSLLLPSAIMAKGYMGGRSEIVVAEELPATTTDDSEGVPDTVDGPINDKMADSGKLFGDLYVILRQQGELYEEKLVPETNPDGTPKLTGDIQLLVKSPTVVGGEPVLTVIDPESTFTTLKDYGWYAAEAGVDDNGNPIYEAKQSPYPAQCVQPVANFDRWGNINSKTGLTKNRLPLIITYDATWQRSECAVGEISGDVTANTDGELTIPINEYFIPPCKDIDGNAIAGADCTWTDPVNGKVTYPYGALWTDLIGEVRFGRLNLSRSPEAVLQSAFDEAISTINSDDTIAIEIDAAGRILLTKKVYDDFRVDPDTGLPLELAPVKKAIDSPLENLALYVKLMKDGHLVTPADKRAPIDRSKNGGIPLWKMLELEDGPIDAALRPTIDINKMEHWGLGNLVIDSESTAITTYYAFFVCMDASGVSEVDCLVWDDTPVQPELDGAWVANPLAVTRKVVTTTDLTECPYVVDSNGSPIYNDDNSYQYTCEGPFTGIESNVTELLDSDDFKFASAFLAAAADKTGDITVDMVVYLNSILGINSVLGYSAYNEDGTPTADAIDYSKQPIYYDFRIVKDYSRLSVFSSRGNAGSVNVLTGVSPSWTEKLVPLLPTVDIVLGPLYDNIGRYIETAFPNGDEAANNILGFTQQTDDNLSVIKFIHTYQVPELR